MGSLIEPPGCPWSPGQFCAAVTKKRAFPREHAAWGGARRRCHDPENPHFHHYGGRGITMAPEWFVSFDAFIDHIGPRTSPKHSLDRIDNDGNYEPGNVRWATWKEQAANKRPSKRRRVRGEAADARRLRAAGWTVTPPEPEPGERSPDTDGRQTP